MTLRHIAIVSVVLLSTAAVFGCAPPPPPPDTRAADEAAIRKADADWAQAAQTKQVAAWTAFYADDAVVQPPNAKIADDKASIDATVAGLFKLRDLKLGWQTTKVEVARSGDLAYARGTYGASWRNNRGRPVKEVGKYVEVWRKQPDGEWKCIVDTWNTDQ